jgi:C4-dicarboxylate-specific signal transduction histidine kinase
MANAIYLSVVARLSVQAPLLAKGLVEAALQRRGLTSDTVSPFQMKQVLNQELLPKLRRINGGSDQTQSRHLATIELSASGEVVRVDPSLRLFLRGIRTGDTAALREELVARGVLRPASERGTRTSVTRIKEANSVLEITHVPLGPRGDAGEVVIVEDVTIEEALEAEMEQTLARLEAAHNDLKRTQVEMVKNETLARLGGLVAGIAHEVNTPVGIGVTAATHLAAQVNLLRQDMTDGRLKKSALESFIADAAESTRLLVTNLARAAELVRSFKQIAVDQTHQQVRDLELGAYLVDVLASLSPRLRRSSVSARVENESPIPIRASAGAIAQVISNLVLNALIHAFPDGRAGAIVVAARAEEGRVLLSCSDDGVGMAPEVRDRAFLPFFTTRRQEGGSGLGLSIVHNLVTSTLGGNIEIDSTPGLGSSFLMRFPTHPVASSDPKEVSS